MFDVPLWPSDDEGQNSSQCQEILSNQSRKKKVKKQFEETVDLNKSTKKRNSKANGESDLQDRKKLKSSVNKNNEENQVGNLLKCGIKFSSETEVNVFAKTEKKKRKKKNKEKFKNDIKEHQNLIKHDEPNVKIKKKVRKRKDVDKGEKVDTQITVKSESKSPGLSPKFDLPRLKASLSQENYLAEPPKLTPILNPAKKKLTSSQFRYINEKLYTQRGAQSLKMFSSDKDSFRIYHEGYAEQLRKWPKDPLNIIIPSILKQKPSNKVIADFGCGEARLARAASGSCKKIHSFDLVALNDLVTVCDMANTQLNPRSVDIAVFCLSLMGMNLRDYLKEANRVLKLGGELKIAEVESRFQDMPVEDFIKILERFGFKLTSKDLSHKFFYIMDFEKVHDCGKKVPEFNLKPCIYKKR